MPDITASYGWPFDFIAFYISPILHSRRNVCIYDILSKSIFRTEHLPSVRVIYMHRSDEFMSVCMCVCVYPQTHTHTLLENVISISFHFNINYTSRSSSNKDCLKK